MDPHPLDLASRLVNAFHTSARHRIAIAVGAMVTGLFDWSNIWIYLLAEFAGGAAAAYAFVYVLPAEKAAGDIEAASTE